MPSQESVINDLFSAVNEGNTDKAKDCLAPALSDDAKTSLINSIPAGSTVKITGLDKSMSESTAVCEVSYSKGSSQKYTVKLVRSANHIGWAVASVDFSFADTSSATASSAADQSNESSDATQQNSEDAAQQDADGSNADGAVSGESSSSDSNQSDSAQSASGNTDTSNANGDANAA